MTPASMLAADMLKTVSRLIGVLDREIETLRAMKPAELCDLQDEKIALSTAYESQVKALQDLPQALDQIEPVLRDELRAVIADFRRALADNERALRDAKAATDEVLRAIADEIQHRTQGPATYGAPRGGKAKSGAAGDPISLSLNQSV